MPSTTQLNNLLQHVKSLVEHQKEIATIKAERFNVFSILKMESKENETHSAFLGELLNPKGSHLLASKFLKLFLKHLDLENYIDAEKASVILEYFIGNVDLENKTGGRIDILIRDDLSGNLISIENKIYASDQAFQIERYVNYKTDKNKVFYLTLYGKSPDNTNENLKEGEDFHILSYQNDIVAWLNECMMLATDLPILRESIKQYKILIEKLTGKMQNKDEEKLMSLILENYEAAEYIAQNFNKSLEKVQDELRNLVIKKLQEEIEAEFEVICGNKINSKFAQIWIKFKNQANSLHFGIESFNGKGHFDGKLFIGVFGDPKNEKFNTLNSETTFGWWKNYAFFKYNDTEIQLQDISIISTLAKDTNAMAKMVYNIVTQSKDYINAHKKQIKI